jgi:hypothetical protein
MQDHNVGLRVGAENRQLPPVRRPVEFLKCRRFEACNPAAGRATEWLNPQIGHAVFGYRIGQCFSIWRECWRAGDSGIRREGALRRLRSGSKLDDMEFYDAGSASRGKGQFFPLGERLTPEMISDVPGPLLAFPLAQTSS